MFEKRELVAGWRTRTEVASPPLQVLEFGPNDFTSASSEQVIRAVRGVRADFADGLLFWVKAMEASKWNGTQQYFTSYVEAALCEQIDSREFAHIVAEYSGELVPPLPEFLLDLTGWQAGRRMYAEWNDVAVVGELADSYILYEWSTSA
jgi:hypothetical protein